MKFKIELTEQEINLVAQAIGELPFRIAEPLMRNLQEQVNGQQEQEAPPKDAVIQ